jgi:hypothetical protein
MNAGFDLTNLGCEMEWLREKSMEVAEAGAKKGERERLEASRGEAETLRVMELEMENFRLNKLVAELLLKNQQLRKAD